MSFREGVWVGEVSLAITARAVYLELPANVRSPDAPSRGATGTLDKDGL
jgi:hypothetical protein